MADNISPEEKLFKVIREGKKDGSKPASGPHGIKGFFAGFSFDKLGKNIFTARPRPPRAAISGAPGTFSISLSDIKPKTVNTALAVILAALTALVIYTAIKERPRIAAIAEKATAAPAEAVETEAIEAFKPVKFYLDEVEKRNIFQPISAQKTEEEKVDPKKVAMDTLGALAADLQLQGISWGQSSKAMIKSEKEDKMYFLGEGQAIGSTGIKVKAIHKDEIVISYEDAEMELL